MSHILTNYNDTGILICTNRNGSETGISEAGLALNSNFKAITARVPYTGAADDLDLGSHTLVCGVMKVGDPTVADWTAPGRLTVRDHSDPRIDLCSDGGIALISKLSGAWNGLTSLFVVQTNANGDMVFTTVFNDPSKGIVIKDGGRLLVATAADDGSSALQVDGKTSLDNGSLTTDGLGTLRLHSQSTPPAAVAGGIYFDGTNFNFCANGSTWVALTLP